MSREQYVLVGGAASLEVVHARDAAEAVQRLRVEAVVEALLEVVGVDDRLREADQDHLREALEDSRAVGRRRRCKRSRTSISAALGSEGGPSTHIFSK